MSEIITTTRAGIVPTSRVGIAIRQATLADVPFMDSLQKQYNKQLGYFPTKQFEGYVALGAILIAEEKRSTDCADSTDLKNQSAQSAKSVDQPLRLGYVISRDRYLKRDELGVIYQLCVAPGTQRKLLGASLIAEVFSRSAYGCRLYCCWCAQDLSANYFWESLGFVPIAFRAGSAKKKRVHIFWQRRVHQDDVTTPYWYPSSTTGGAIAQDRLVFPIPPGVHWKDVQPIVLPGSAEAAATRQRIGGPKRSKTKAPPVLPSSAIRCGGLRVGPVELLPVVKEKVEAPLDAARERKPKAKCDPALVAKARELRDRWMDQLNRAAPALGDGGKYEVGRLLLRDDSRRRQAQVLPAA
jgi:ribosomal protein S18 acetylase RimI-like enzyme